MQAPDMTERYEACMVLAGAGDALGFGPGGNWEVFRSASAILHNLESFGGLENLIIRGWMVSDDTVMHIATAEALLLTRHSPRRDTIFEKLSEKYTQCCATNMSGRSPGKRCMRTMLLVQRGQMKYNQIPYNPQGGGCGGAMRAMCIGLLYPGESRRDQLIEVAIESGRMTHNHPTGFLGALVAALFAAYAIEGVPLGEWGRRMLALLPRVYAWLERSGRNWREYSADGGRELHAFGAKWAAYLTLRHLADPGQTEPVFPEPFDFRERDEFYASLACGHVGGASGHDATIIAYDALLGCQGNWDELVRRACIHGGDSDSTGTIAAHYEGIEYEGKLRSLGRQLYRAATPPTASSNE
ncbi:putative ADP-ribosylarginine hydrolase [Paratrimastix pyriformis]|uniref:ADP-ribosylhydrolase ARH1 n=1 Tax=Paratrimastix pyriformis TaxID=342808 RepID=A0ABQ8U6Q3_9EUKA|nr:putative ADP-ribosylarginine hydrolase [Paratrimastix pyriformis]